MGNGIQFTKLIEDKRGVSLIFTDNFELNYRLLNQIYHWADSFEEITLLFPEYQQDFFDWIVSDPKILIRTVEKYVPNQQTTILISFSESAAAQKIGKKFNNGILAGFSKHSNINIVPETSDPLILSERIEDVLRIAKKSNLNHLQLPKSDGKKTNSGASFVFDINSVIGRFRLNQILKKKPTLNYLLGSTAKFTKEMTIHTDKLEKRTLTLKEVVLYSGSAQRIITDNYDFYKLMSNFRIKDKIYFFGGSQADKKIGLNDIDRLIESL